jgi:four helix bundle protein
MLTHDKLKVYQKALDLASSAVGFSVSWGRKHAVTDQFRRASESIVLHIAEGARLRSRAEKVRSLDYATGSSLECAACLDLATMKTCLTAERSLMEKTGYREITRMLIGLRKAWRQPHFGEDPVPFQVRQPQLGTHPLFHHESLDVYQTGLRFIEWWVALPGAMELSHQLCRDIDRSVTSVVLNIAEGNGRYAELDHRRFLEIATTSAVKTAAYLDLFHRAMLPASMDIHQGRELLSRIVAMLNRF